MKLVIFMAFVAALAVEGTPTRDNSDISSASELMEGQLHEVQRLLNDMHNSKLQLSSFENDDIRHITPQVDGRFYAEAEQSFHHRVNDNGKVQEASGGHKIVNNNGKVEEWDFQPQKPNY